MQRAVHVTASTRASFDRAKAALVREPAGILSDEQGARDRRTFLVNLAVNVGRGGSSVHQRVEVHLKGVHLEGRVARWEFEWNAVGHPGLFPVMHGELTLEPRETHALLTLRGTYEPPMGVVGAVGDSVAGRRVARQSVTDYVARVAQRVDAAVDADLASVAWHPAPYPTREPPGSER
jgi:hypothetical protein